MRLSPGCLPEEQVPPPAAPPPQSSRAGQHAASTGRERLSARGAAHQPCRHSPSTTWPPRPSPVRPRQTHLPPLRPAAGSVTLSPQPASVHAGPDRKLHELSTSRPAGAPSGRGQHVSAGTRGLHSARPPGAWARGSQLACRAQALWRGWAQTRSTELRARSKHGRSQGPALRISTRGHCLLHEANPGATRTHGKLTSEHVL